MRHITHERGLNTDMSGLNGMHELQTRQRMRPWLESRINSREITGLEWVNRDKKVFKVPWKHVGNRDWCESDGKIFKEWAIHTGKFRENVDQPDFPTWKTRFRCALTKLPDIKELKDQNRLDQQTLEPYRVYMFLPRNNDVNEVPMNPLTPMTPYENQNTNQGYEMAMCPNYQEVEPALPTTINSDGVSMEENRSMDARLDSDLRNIPSGDIFHPSNDIEIPDHIASVDKKDLHINPCDIKQEYEEVEMETNESTDQRAIVTIANKPIHGEQSLIQRDIKPITLDLHDNAIHVTVKYCQDMVLEKKFSHPAGCHIYYDLNVQLGGGDEHLQQMMFGPSDAYQIPLPECQSLNSNQINLTSQLLRAADRGVLLRMENGNIIATRKCRCSIFVLSPSINNGELTKLVREEPTLIFDLQSYFRPAVEKYMYKRDLKPDPGVVLSFGQRFNNTNESLNNLLISARIEHCAARASLMKIACSSPLSPPIEISTSDNYDRILDVMHFSTQGMAGENQVAYR